MSPWIAGSGVKGSGAVLTVALLLAMCSAVSCEEFAPLYSPNFETRECKEVSTGCGRDGCTNIGSCNVTTSTPVTSITINRDFLFKFYLTGNDNRTVDVEATRVAGRLGLRLSLELPSARAKAITVLLKMSYFNSGEDYFQTMQVQMLHLKTSFPAIMDIQPSLHNGIETTAVAGFRVTYAQRAVSINSLKKWVSYGVRNWRIGTLSTDVPEYVTTLQTHQSVGQAPFWIFGLNPDSSCVLISAEEEPNSPELFCFEYEQFQAAHSVCGAGRAGVKGAVSTYQRLVFNTNAGVVQITTSLARKVTVSNILASCVDGISTPSGQGSELSLENENFYDTVYAWEGLNIYKSTGVKSPFETLTDGTGTLFTTSLVDYLLTGAKVVGVTTSILHPTMVAVFVDTNNHTDSEIAYRTFYLNAKKQWKASGGLASHVGSSSSTEYLQMANLSWAADRHKVNITNVHHSSISSVIYYWGSCVIVSRDMGASYHVLWTSSDTNVWVVDLISNTQGTVVFRTLGDGTTRLYVGLAFSPVVTEVKAVPTSATQASTYFFTVNDVLVEGSVATGVKTVDFTTNFDLATNVQGYLRRYGQKTKTSCLVRETEITTDITSRLTRGARDTTGTQVIYKVPPVYLDRNSNFTITIKKTLEYPTNELLEGFKLQGSLVPDNLITVSQSKTIDSEEGRVSFELTFTDTALAARATPGALSHVTHFTYSFTNTTMACEQSETARGSILSQTVQTVRMYSGCPPDVKLEIDTSSTYAAINERIRCNIVENETMCIYFGDLFAPKFVVKDVVAREESPYTGSYKMRVVGWGPSSDVTYYSDEELDKYNDGLLTLYTVTRSDSGSIENIEWLSHPVNPFGGVVPSTLGVSPVLYLAVEFTVGADTDVTTYCELKDTVILRVHGISAGAFHIVASSLGGIVIGWCIILCAYMVVRIRWGRWLKNYTVTHKMKKSATLQ